MRVAQNSPGPVCPVPLTVRGTLGPWNVKSASDRVKNPSPFLVSRRTREALPNRSLLRPAARLHAELRDLGAERPDLRVGVVPGRRRRRRRSLRLHRREEQDFADGVLVREEHGQPINTCVEINQCVGCTSHFAAITPPCWLRRAVRNRQRHAIEQASRRWRGGRRDDSGRRRREILISAQTTR